MDDINIEMKLFKKKAILSAPTALRSQATKWAKDKGATEEFIALAEIFWNLATSDCGVNPVVAYAQSAVETSFGRFNHKLTKECKNTGGLKIVGNREEADNYARFKSWSNGVEAHLDHLALYSGAKMYPKKSTNDPRHFAYLLGTVKFVEDLFGNWSSAEDYSKKICLYISEIEEGASDEKLETLTLDNEPLVENEVQDLAIEEFKNELASIIEDIEKLKIRTAGLMLYIGSLEEVVIQEKKLQQILKENNTSLKERNKNYEHIIGDVLKIIGDSKNII